MHVLTVTVPPADLWTGVVNNGTYGTWDINTTANWKISGSAGNYLDGTPAQFDDTASIFQVGGVGIVSPLSIAFDNSANNYTLLNTLATSPTGARTGMRRSLALSNCKRSISACRPASCSSWARSRST